jgi:hypothetical protein
MLNDKQLIVLFAVMLIAWGTTFMALNHLSKPPSSLEQHADKFCQELYGPQTGHKWVDDELKCQTVRGEILPLRGLK